MQIKKSIPIALWIAIIGMGIFALVHLISGFSIPIQFVAFIVNAILLFGLYYGKKWAFIITIIISLIVPMIIILLDVKTAILILFLNSIVLIPLIFSTRYFYPWQKEETKN